MKFPMVRIITQDTGKTYNFPDEDREYSEVWEVEIKIHAINENGHVEKNNMTNKVIHLERKTLEDAGLLPNKNWEINTIGPKKLIPLFLFKLLGHAKHYPEVYPRQEPNVKM